MRSTCRILGVGAADREETGLNLAVSAGILTDDQARRLAEGGVHRYNHNLETARSHFAKVVTTHSWDDRQQTCELVRNHGMELCCGVLLGMGETAAQRLELLEELRAVDPTEVPVNFLNPRPGTPMGDYPIVGAMEAIRWIALFRLALPGVILRYAGGREVTLRELQALGLTSGINALIVGNYLTTLGRTPDEDLQMLEDLQMPVGVLGKVFSLSVGPWPARRMLSTVRPAGDRRRTVLVAAAKSDLPRFCSICGTRLAVVVTPGGFVGRCKVHGEVARG